MATLLIVVVDNASFMDIIINHCIDVCDHRYIGPILLLSGIYGWDVRMTPEYAGSGMLYGQWFPYDHSGADIIGTGGGAKPWGGGGQCVSEKPHAKKVCLYEGAPGGAHPTPWIHHCHYRTEVTDGFFQRPKRDLSFPKFCLPFLIS